MKGLSKVEHYEETIVKFLDALNVDLIGDVHYQGKCYGGYHCVCGQRIKKGYIFENKKNYKVCIVGEKCLQYIADYLCW